MPQKKMKSARGGKKDRHSHCPHFDPKAPTANRAVIYRSRQGAHLRVGVKCEACARVFPIESHKPKDYAMFRVRYGRPITTDELITAITTTPLNPYWVQRDRHSNIDKIVYECAVVWRS
jgi:hypothetical protein